MSIFTMSLAEVIELHGRDNIGLDTYPVISETYRTRINELVIDQYLNREIGQETFSLFRHAMRRKMSQIMPTYNELYQTKTLIVDPLRTVDLQTLTITDASEEASSDSDTHGVSSGDTTVTSGSVSRQVGSDTPQVFLSDNGNYASSANDGNSQATAETQASETATNSTDVETSRTSHDVMDSKTTGFQGSQAELVMAFRQTIINIDMMIVNELSSLFMGIWNNGDSYFNRRYY